jgi:uncharacterized protein with PIN domain
MPRIKRVFYDTWAWTEVADDASSVGRELRKAYGPDGPAEIHTSAFALAELVGRLSRLGQGDLGARWAREIQRQHTVHGLELEDLDEMGRQHGRLHSHRAKASVADTAMYCQAKRLRMPLITADEAFDGEPESAVPGRWRIAARKQRVDRSARRTR